MPEPVLDVPKIHGKANEDGEKQEINEETIDKSAVNEDVDSKTNVKMAAHDVMRNEPILTSLIIESYEGEKDKRGFFHGVGTAYFKGGHVYTGAFVHGKMDGLGKYVWDNGIIYEGDFKENRIEGTGKYTWKDNSVYEGEVLNGLRHGQGTFDCGCLPSVYTGEWNHGKRHGKGHLRYDEEGRSDYDGHWFNNNRHGHGIRRYASGNEYNGDWKDNMRHGDGNMTWDDKEQLQSYQGQWEYGMQHGHGEHSWYLKRIPGSQYPLRNYYAGDWCNGLRQGYGTFMFASGAKYIGEWISNMKHGKGRYIFKNGHIFEGNFEQDHMLEFPEFNPSGMTTPDIANSGIPMRPLTPLRSATPFIPTESSTLGINNPLSIKIDHLFDDLELYLEDRQEELQSVTHVILRHMSRLKQIYTFYSGLGQEYSTDNTFAMTRMQFWRFLKDCKIHHHGLTLIEIDRFIDTNASTEIHEPQHKVLSRDFINAIVMIGYHVYHDQCCKKRAIFAECTSKIISQNILDNACTVQGSLFPSANKAEEASKYMQKSWDIFFGLCIPYKLAPYEPTFKARQFLFMLNEFKLFNNALTPKEVIGILSKDNPHLAQADFCNLELEITFLDFFEGLIDCALVYVNEKMIMRSHSAKLSPEAGSIRSRSAECYSPLTSKPGESPEEDRENMVEYSLGSPMANEPQVRSQLGLTDSPEQKTTTRESATKTHEGLSKEGKTPDTAQQLDSQETKRTASQHSGNNMLQQSGSKTSRTESETPGAGLGAVPDEEDQSPSPVVIASSPQLDHQSTNVWATQLSIFFEKFFSSADRLEMIKKETHKSNERH